MTKGVNKVIILGNLGKDPEIRAYQGGSSATLSIATSESWKDKATGEKQEKTEWHQVVFFNRLAEVVAQYVRKGSKLYVEGRLETKKWTDKQGVERYTTQIIGSELQMLDGKNGAERDPTASTGYAKKGADEYRAASGGGVEAPPMVDDDIPF